MDLESINAVFTKTLALKSESIDYESLLPMLRKFRSTIGVEGSKFQHSCFHHASLILNLVKFVDKMFVVDSVNADATLAFSIGVQCVVNLMTNNDSIRKDFAEKYSDKLVNWLATVELNHQNYVCAALYNINMVDGLQEHITCPDFIRSLTKCGESGVEFAVLLLENLIRSREFIKMFNLVSDDQKLYLLELLESVISEFSDDKYIGEVKFVRDLFCKLCDRIMITNMSSINSHSAKELKSTLDFLAFVSYKSGYNELLQNDTPLVINISYLLRGIHECASQKKERTAAAAEMFELIHCKNNQMVEKPFFRVKGNLIRLLGNLAHENKKNQDQIRDANCIPIILDSCNLDAENPFIKEWSILAIRNLCYQNPENQNFIREMNFQGCDFSVVDEKSLLLNDDGKNQIKLAPIQR